MALRSIHATQQGHHIDIQQRRYERRPGIRNDPVVDQKTRVARLHGQNGIRKNFADFIVGPVWQTDRI